MNIKNTWFYELLQCPDCSGDLKDTGPIKCSICNFRPSEHIDFRPQNPKSRTLLFSPILKQNPKKYIDSIPIGPPQITFKGPMPGRDSRAFFSILEKRSTDGRRFLDLGCGPRDQAEPAIYIGYDYVGIDFESNSADLLADAHVIPFKNNSFDCILAYAVFEHLHNPFIVIQEVERVLKPGGLFLGTVSQGEPFHSSFFHHSAWGMASLIWTTESLKILQLWWSMDTLRALFRMGGYSKIIKQILRFLDFTNTHLAILTPRKMKWNKKEKAVDTLHRAGSIAFMITKESL